MALIFDKASGLPPLAGWNGFLVGKSVELVLPVTYALPALSTAIPARVIPAATQICGVNQSRARGVNLGHEGVSIIGAACASVADRLERAGRGGKVA